jgi:hypothetical protein
MLGSNVTINYALYGMQQLAQNVTGIQVPLSGHWIPEERPVLYNKKRCLVFISGSTKIIISMDSFS